MAALVVLLLTLPGSAATWKIQLNYDKDASALELHDLQCPSAQVCVAGGVIVDTSSGKDKIQGTVVITTDGGAHWKFEEVREVPESLFFLNDSTGWMVTATGVWQTLETGRDWTKVATMKGLAKVWFLDALHGFAVGGPKSIYETKNGGKDWTFLAASNLPKADAEATTFDTIIFSGKLGLISATVAPENAGLRRSIGAVLLVTADAGKTWESKPLNLQGRITCMRALNQPNHALAVIEYVGKAKYPAELFTLDLETLETHAVFRQTDRVARDAVVLPDGQVLVASVERMGEMSEVPIPSKLRMMESTSLDTWLPESADYRAVAMRPMLAVADAHNVWVATDTGMILKRVE